MSSPVATTMMPSDSTRKPAPTRRARPSLPRPYRTWGYPVTPIVFVLAALYISISALVTQPRDALAGLAIIAAGLPAYFYWRRRVGRA